MYLLAMPIINISYIPYYYALHMCKVVSFAHYLNFAIIVDATVFFTE